MSFIQSYVYVVEPKPALADYLRARGEPDPFLLRPIAWVMGDSTGVLPTVLMQTFKLQHLAWACVEFDLPSYLPAGWTPSLDAFDVLWTARRVPVYGTGDDLWEEIRKFDFSRVPLTGNEDVDAWIEGMREGDE